MCVHNILILILLIRIFFTQLGAWFHAIHVQGDPPGQQFLDEGQVLWSCPILTLERAVHQAFSLEEPTISETCDINKPTILISSSFRSVCQDTCQHQRGIAILVARIDIGALHWALQSKHPRWMSASRLIRITFGFPKQSLLTFANWDHGNVTSLALCTPTNLHDEYLTSFIRCNAKIEGEEVHLYRQHKSRLCIWSSRWHKKSPSSPAFCKARSKLAMLTEYWQASGQWTDVLRWSWARAGLLGVRQTLRLMFETLPTDVKIAFL